MIKYTAVVVAALAFGSHAVAQGDGAVRINCALNGTPFNQGSVMIDGRIVGQCPRADVILAAGPHRVSVEAQGDQGRYAWSSTVTVGANSVTQVTAALAAVPTAQPAPATGDPSPLEKLWALSTVVLRGNASEVNAVALTRDGRTVASGADDGSVRIWDVQSEQLLGVLRSERVVDLQFSPDGAVLAAALVDGTVQLWDTATRTPIRSLTGHAGAVMRVAFSPDGATLASASTDRTAKLWTVATGDLLVTLEGHAAGVRGVAFSPDGRTVATASADGSARLWSVKTGSSVRTFQSNASGLWSAQFSPDGTTLSTASEDTTVRLWRVASGEMLRIFQGHTRAVYKVTYRPDGQALASASEDGTIRIWTVASGASAAVLKDHGAPVFDVRYSADGRRLVSASADKTARVFPAFLLGATGAGDAWARMKAAPDLRSLDAFQQSFPTSPLRPEVEAARQRLVASTAQKQAAEAEREKQKQAAAAAFAQKLRAFRERAAIEPFVFDDGFPSEVKFSPDGRTIASGSRTGIQLRRADTGAVLRSLTGSHPVTGVAFSPDGRLVVGAYSTSITVWMTETGTVVRTLTTKGHVADIAFSRDSRVLASAEGNGVLLRSVEDGNVVGTLTGHVFPVVEVAFSPDGRTLATASGDATLKLWSLDDGKLQRTLSGHTSIVNTVLFTPDGRTLVSGSQDGTLKFWSLASTDAPRSIGPLNGAPTGLSLTSDGRTLAVALYSGGILVGPVAGPLSSLYQRGNRVQFSPDGQTLAIGHAPTPGPGTSNTLLALNVTTPDALWTVIQRAPTLEAVDAYIELFPNTPGIPQARVLKGKLAEAAKATQEAARAEQAAAEARARAEAEQKRLQELADTMQARADAVVEFKQRVGTELEEVDWIEAVAWFPNGTRIAVKTSEAVGVFDARTGEEVYRIAEKTTAAQALSVAVSPDGRTLAVGTAAGLRLYDAATGRFQRVVEEQGLRCIFGGCFRTGSVIVYSPDGRTIASDDGKGHVTVWDVSDGRVLRSLNDGESPNFATARLAFSPDGQRLALSRGDGPIRVWEVATGRPLLTLPAGGKLMHDVVFSADGQVVIAHSGDDRTVRLMTAATGDQLRLLNASQWISDLHVEPNTNGLAFLKDGVLTVYRPATASSPAVQWKGDGSLRDLAFSPDGRMISYAIGQSTFVMDVRYLSAFTPDDIWDVLKSNPSRRGVELFVDVFTDSPHRAAAERLQVP